MLGYWKGKSMNLLNLPQAVAWICTREERAVKAIGEEPLDMQLLVAKQRWLEGMTSVTRWRASLDNNVGKPGKTEVIQRNEHASFQEALKGLMMAHQNGYLSLYVAHNGELRALTTVELQDLEIRVYNDLTGTLGLLNTKLGNFSYVNPQFLLKDLERLWPGPIVPVTIAMTRTILLALMQATEGGPLKKEQALELTQKLPGFGRRRFEDAWRQLPAGHKVGRGKRGPKRHAA
jgi:hypothetical protein